MYKKIAEILITALLVCNVLCYGTIADEIESLESQIETEVTETETTETEELETSEEETSEEAESSDETEEPEESSEPEELEEPEEPEESSETEETEESEESEESSETVESEADEETSETEETEIATDSEITEEETETSEEETEIATDSEITEEENEELATSSEIDEIILPKFILATESFVERNENTYRMIKDLCVGDSLYLIDDEFYYFDGENYITTEIDEEKLVYENIDEVIANNTDKSTIVLDMNGFDIISTNENRIYNEKESLFKVYGTTLTIYGNYSLYNEEHEYLVEDTLVSDFGHIIPQMEEQALYLDDVRLELDNVYINGGDGRDSSGGIGGNGADAICFSQNEDNSLTIYNGLITGGKGGTGKGTTTSFGGGVLTGKNGANYTFSYSSNGKNGDKGCGCGGNAIFTKCDSVLKKTIVKDVSINGGNGGKRNIPLLRALPAFSDPYFCIAYDEPQYFTSVKNQAYNGLCSSFALMGVIESDILRNYGSQVPKIMHSNTKELNFSEKMQAYLLHRPKNDPLGNYTVSYTIDESSYQTSSDAWWNVGSNQIYNSRFLSTWQSPIAEYKDAYNSHGLAAGETYQDKTKWKISEYETPVVKLKDFGTYDFKDKTYAEYGNDVKKLISQHGALSIGLMVTTATHGSSLTGNDYTRADGKNVKYVSMFRKSGVAWGGGHDMVLVGWDDNFPKTNFAASGGSLPTIDGAWIVKNSWGPESPDAPLYYISYDHGTDGAADVSYYHMAPSDEFYDYNYMYSFVPDYYVHRFQNGGSWCTIYEIKHNKERLSAVSYMTSYPVDSGNGVTLCILGTTVSGGMLMPDTSNVVYSKANIKIKEGYNLINIDTPIYVKKGEKYAVMFINQSGSECKAAYMDDNPNPDPGHVSTNFYNVTQNGNNFNYANYAFGCWDGSSSYINSYLPSGWSYPISILTEDVPKNFSIKYDSNTGSGTETKAYQKINRDATVSNLTIQKGCSELKGFSFDSNATTATYNIGSNVYDIAKAAFLDLSGTRYDNTDTVTLYAVYGESHTYSSWETVTSATCTTGGTEKATCSVCSSVTTRNTAALGHSGNPCVRCGYKTGGRKTSSGGGGGGGGGGGMLPQNQLPQAQGPAGSAKQVTTDISNISCKTTTGSWQIDQATGKQQFTMVDVNGNITVAKNTIVENQDGSKRYVDENGDLYTGFLQDKTGNINYFEKKEGEDKGKMRFGLTEVDGSFYYLNTVNGSLITGEIIQDINVGFMVADATGKIISKTTLLDANMAMLYAEMRAAIDTGNIEAFKAVQQKYLPVSTSPLGPFTPPLV